MRRRLQFLLEKDAAAQDFGAAMRRKVFVQEIQRQRADQRLMRIPDDIAYLWKTRKELKPASHLGSGGRTRAVVKVQDGCNANCSFCIIPSVRGRSRSIAPDEALAEVRGLVVRGYKEIVFSGIHLGTYGRDLHAKTTFYE